MTEFLFRDDAYLQSTSANVTAITTSGGIVLDRTVFYATSGGQPGDSGQMVRADGSVVTIATAVHPDGDKAQIVHVPAEGGAIREALGVRRAPRIGRQYIRAFSPFRLESTRDATADLAIRAARARVIARLSRLRQGGGCKAWTHPRIARSSPR